MIDPVAPEQWLLKWLTTSREFAAFGAAALVAAGRAASPLDEADVDAHPDNATTTDKAISADTARMRPHFVSPIMPHFSSRGATLNTSVRETCVYCIECGTKNLESAKFCSSCGTRLGTEKKATTTSTSKPLNKDSASAITDGPDSLRGPYPANEVKGTRLSTGWKRALTIIVIVIVGNVIWFSARPYIVGVTIDAGQVEQNIISTYGDQGISVTAECPDPFVARPGETRNCLVTDEFGTKAMAVVTVENTNGDITWVAQ